MTDVYPIRRWLPAGFFACTVILVGLYWVGLAASHDMNYATVGFRMVDAIKKAAVVTPRDLLQDNFTASRIWFVPFGLSIGILYWFFWKSHLRIAFAAIGILIPSLIMTPAVIILVVELPKFLFGMPDGEDWGEAWLTLAAAGTWVLLALVVVLCDAFVLFSERRKQRNAGPPQRRSVDVCGIEFEHAHACETHYVS